MSKNLDIKIKIFKTSNGNYEFIDLRTGLLITMDEISELGTPPREIMIDLAYANKQYLYNRDPAVSRWTRISEKNKDGLEICFESKNPEESNIAEDKGSTTGTGNPLNTVLELIHVTSLKKKPNDFIISDLKWKLLVRSIVKGKNLMMTGPAGCGKTQVVYAAAKALGYNLVCIPLGDTQDPKSTLLGNSHFKNGETQFTDSVFIKAITTPKTIVLLDEMSRANPDAHNILMPVLDPNLRFLRLSDDINSPVINVAKDVSFIATANIGAEYTATRMMDRALMDRFIMFEMDILTEAQESELITSRYPNLGTKEIKAITGIAKDIRNEYMGSSGKIATTISTRTVLEFADTINDGFNIVEAATGCVYPFFSKDGGTDSELTFVKQVVQKYNA